MFFENSLPASWLVRELTSPRLDWPRVGLSAKLSSNRIISTVLSVLWRKPTLRSKLISALFQTVSKPEEHKNRTIYGPKLSWAYLSYYRTKAQQSVRDSYNKNVYGRHAEREYGCRQRHRGSNKVNEAGATTAVQRRDHQTATMSTAI